MNSAAANEPVWTGTGWSTTVSAVFHTNHPERFSESERAELAPGDQGWVTVPVNGLAPDCNPVWREDTDGTVEWVCPCGRSSAPE